MIYITQGHQKGVGLEIYIKSIICMNDDFSNKCILICYKESLIKTLSSLSLDYSLNKNSVLIGKKVIYCNFLTANKHSETTECLLSSLNIISSKDVLITLPTSKDQLEYNGKHYNGYTEFLRSYFDKNITMNFLAANKNVSLLTDHIAIQDVPKILSKDFIVESLNTTLRSFPRKIKSIIFTGINPHAGESGLISADDNVIDDAIITLRKLHQNISFRGPLAGDTVHLSCSKNNNELIVYSYHDQGLSPFKLEFGLTGINLSLGLDFYRVSVDHGTAFEIYVKNIANYNGMIFLLNEVNRWA